LWDYPGEPVPEGKTNPDFTEARDSECHWHQLGHMQVYTLFQTDNHASTQPLSFFTGRLPFLPPNQQRQSTGFTSHLTQNRSFRRRFHEPNSLLLGMEKINATQQKHAFTNQKMYYNTSKGRHK